MAAGILPAFCLGFLTLNDGSPMDAGGGAACGKLGDVIKYTFSRSNGAVAVRETGQEGRRGAGIDRSAGANES